MCQQISGIASGIPLIGRGIAGRPALAQRPGPGGVINEKMPAGVAAGIELIAADYLRIWRQPRARAENGGLVRARIEHENAGIIVARAIEPSIGQNRHGIDSMRI